MKKASYRSKKLPTNANLRGLTLPQFRDLYGESREKMKWWAGILAEEIKEYAYSKRLEDDPLCSYTVEEFYLLKRFPEITWRDWCKRYEELGHAVNDAILIFGITREMRGLREKDNVPMIMKVQRFYSPVWKTVEKEQSELKKDTEPNTVLNVNVTPLDQLKNDANS